MQTPLWEAELESGVAEWIGSAIYPLGEFEETGISTGTDEFTFDDGEPLEFSDGETLLLGSSSSGTLVVDDEHTHGGVAALKSTVGPSVSFARARRWLEPRAFRTFDFSAWFYLDADRRLTADAFGDGDRYLSLLDLRSRDRAGSDDIIWSLRLVDNFDSGAGTERPFFALCWNPAGSNILGPFANSPGSAPQRFAAAPSGAAGTTTTPSVPRNVNAVPEDGGTTVTWDPSTSDGTTGGGGYPVATWFKVHVAILQSSHDIDGNPRYDGAIDIWIDVGGGEQLAFSLGACRTGRFHTGFNGWRSNCEVTVGLSTDGVDTACSCWIDDVVITIDDITDLVPELPIIGIQPHTPGHIAASHEQNDLVEWWKHPDTGRFYLPGDFVAKERIGEAGGVAPIDEDGFIPEELIPGGIVSSGLREGLNVLTALSTGVFLQTPGALGNLAVGSYAGTSAVPLGVPKGWLLGRYAFGGSFSTTVPPGMQWNAAAIESETTEVWTSAAQGTDVWFATTAKGANQSRRVGRFRDDGSFEVGTSARLLADKVSMFGDPANLSNIHAMVFSTVASSQTITVFNAGFSFTSYDIGKVIVGGFPNIPLDTRVVAVAADGQTATMSNAATLSAPLVITTLGALQFLPPSYRLRSTDSYIGHYAYVPAGSPTSTDPWNVTTRLTQLNMFLDADTMSDAQSLVLGPRGFDHWEGPVVFGPNKPRRDSPGPWLNNMLTYANQAGKFVAPGGLITGCTLSPEIVGGGLGGTLALDAVYGHGSNHVLTSRSDGKLWVGALIDFATLDYIFVGEASVFSPGLATGVGRWVGYSVVPPSLNSGGPGGTTAPTLGAATGVQIGGNAFRLVTGCSLADRPEAPTDALRTTIIADQFFQFTKKDIGFLIGFRGLPITHRSIVDVITGSEIVVDAPIDIDFQGATAFIQDEAQPFYGKAWQADGPEYGNNTRVWYRGAGYTSFVPPWGATVTYDFGSPVWHNGISYRSVRGAWVTGATYQIDHRVWRSGLGYRSIAADNATDPASAQSAGWELDIEADRVPPSAPNWWAETSESISPPLGNAFWAEVDMPRTAGLLNADATVYLPTRQRVSSTDPIEPVATCVYITTPDTDEVILPYPNISGTQACEGKMLLVVNNGPGPVTLTNGQGVFLGANSTITLNPTDSVWFRGTDGGFVRWYMSSGSVSGAGANANALTLDGVFHNVTSAFGTYGSKAFGIFGTLTFDYAGGAVEAPTYAPNDQILQQLLWRGYNPSGPFGAKWENAASIVVSTEQDYNVPGARGGRIDFKTSSINAPTWTIGTVYAFNDYATYDVINGPGVVKHVFQTINPIWDITATYPLGYRVWWVGNGYVALAETTGDNPTGGAPWQADPAANLAPVNNSLWWNDLGPVAELATRVSIDHAGRLLPFNGMTLVNFKFITSPPTASEGTPLWIAHNEILDYGAGLGGPRSSSSYRSPWQDTNHQGFPQIMAGPRGILTIEGTTQFNRNAGFAGGTVSFQVFNVMKNLPGTSLGLGSTAQINNSPQIVADGARCWFNFVPSIRAPELPEDAFGFGPGISGFSDDPYFTAINGGFLDAPEATSIGFWHLPVFCGHVHWGKRIDSMASELYFGFDLVTGDRPVVDLHIGYYVQPLQNAITNVGLWNCSTTVLKPMPVQDVSDGLTPIIVNASVVHLTSPTDVTLPSASIQLAGTAQDTVVVVMNVGTGNITIPAAGVVTPNQQPLILREWESATFQRVGFGWMTLSAQVATPQFLGVTSENGVGVGGGAFWGFNGAGDAILRNITALGALGISQPTVGQPVVTLSSVATNDDPTETTYQFRGTTTNATLTTLGSITIPASKTVMLEARVVARRTGGTAGIVDDAASYVLIATIKGNLGTNASLAGTLAHLSQQESQAAWDAIIDTSAGTARVRVQGALNNNITWHATIRAYPVGL